MTQPAILALADGRVFEGLALGISGQTTGELVFNTALSGYQEILSDPSYAQQIITFTYPHIGNVGSNSFDNESSKTYASGLVIKDESLLSSNYRSESTLHHFLLQQQMLGIAGIDTRALTEHLRIFGAQNACIQTENLNVSNAIAQAKNAPSLNGLDLASQVSCKEIYHWQKTSWHWQTGVSEIARKDLPYHVIVYDYGVKTNILNMLVDRGCFVTVVPAQLSAQEVLALKPDGIVLSNGPGDPGACHYAIKAIQILLDSNIPLFGICLGHQLLALASEAKTFKMKLGHHGSNHPVIGLRTAKVAITSQNHGFAVCEDSLPAHLEITHRSLFDNTIQGIAHKQKPALGFQGHPEASPGPQDIAGLFDEFKQLLAR